jgi:hypothetical protein
MKTIRLIKIIFKSHQTENAAPKDLVKAIAPRNDLFAFSVDNSSMHDVPSSPPRPLAPAAQARNPLHGLTLQAIVTQLADFYGWDELGQRIPVRCFTHEPSVNSSLKFLRKTPWAREKVEGLYLFMLREQKRQGRADSNA